jgi:hypothetical protein
MRHSNLIDPCVTFILGLGLGLLASVGAQKMLNRHYQATCHDTPGHNLVLTRGFLGEQYYCINSKYVN